MARLLHFPLLGEPLAVDLMNTRVHRKEGDLDLLDAPPALAALAVVLVAQRTGTRSAGALRRLNAALFVPTATARPVHAAAQPTAICERGALSRTLAGDAVTVLGDPSADLQPGCAHPDWVMQFIRSNPRRRWRSASVCKNRTQVARDHLRRRADC